MNISSLTDDFFAQLSSLFDITDSAVSAVLFLLALLLLFSLFTLVLKKILNESQSACAEAEQLAFTIRDKERQTAYIQGLHVEAKIDLAWYLSEIGELLDNLSKSKILKQHVLDHKPLFQMYHQDVAKIVQIKNDALRLQIVKANSLFKGVSNLLCLNKELYAHYLMLKAKADQSERPIDEQAAQQQKLVLQKLALRILAEHEKMLPQMRQMIAMLGASRQENG